MNTSRNVTVTDWQQGKSGSRQDAVAGEVPVAMPPNPATANIEGYLQLGRSLLKKRAGSRHDG